MKGKIAKAWIDALAWLKMRKDAPDVLMDHTLTMYRKALRGMDKPKTSLPAFLDTSKIKAKIERELEATCKRIVKRRDLGKDGWGKCISCPKYSNRLQWGHFIPQHKSAWLRFWPQNSAMQCENCNGFGHGMTFEFGQAIDARDGMGAAAALLAEKDGPVGWVPSISNLEKRLEDVRALEKA